MELSLLIERMTAGGTPFGLEVPTLRARRACKPLPGGPGGGLGRGRGGLREPLGQLRVRRQAADRPRADDDRRRLRWPTASGASRWARWHERAPTCCWRTGPGSTASRSGAPGRPGSARSSSTPRCRATRRRSPTRATPGQIIVFTYPLIGNYGVARAHMESDRIHARAVIMREGDRPRGRRPRRGRLAHLAGRLRHPGPVGCRHTRARATYPRQGCDARRDLRGRGGGGRGARSCDGGAVHDGRGLRARGHARASR